MVWFDSGKEYTKFSRMSDSEIINIIEELKQEIERLSKEEAEHGWEEINGDRRWIDKQRVEIAKQVLHDRKLVKALSGYSEFTKELIQILDENKISYTFEKDKCCSDSEVIKISYDYEYCLIEERESSSDFEKKTEKKIDDNILVFEEAELGSGETEDVMKNFKTELLFALDSHNVKYTVEKDECCPEAENIIASHNNVVVKAKVYTNKKKVIIELIKGDTSDKERFSEAKKDFVQNVKKAHKVKLKGDDYKRYSGEEFNKITHERKAGQAEVYVKSDKVIFDGKEYAVTAKTVDFIVDNVGGKASKYLRSSKIREYEKPEQNESPSGNNLGKQKKLWEEYIRLFRYFISTWYLDHTNWTETKDECLEYIISEDENFFKEIIKTDDAFTKIKLHGYMRDPKYNRESYFTAFAKKTNGKYVFLGVYGDAECKELEDGLFMMTYKKMSNIVYN